MFSSRTLQILGVVCGLFVIAWGAYLYVQVPHASAPFKKTGEAAVILIRQNGRQVELRRKDKQWEAGAGLGGPFYRTDADRVKTLLSGVESLHVEDEISARPQSAAEFEVDAASGTRVTSQAANGKILADGVFGKQAPDFTHIYFRYDDRPNVYLAGGLIRGELGEPGLAYWRDKNLISMAEPDVQSVVIQGPDFKTSLARAGTAAWTLDGKPIDPAPVYALIGQLAHLKADDFVDAAASPTVTMGSLKFAHVTIQGKDRTVELSIGPEDKAAKRYPAATDPLDLAWISESRVAPLLLKPSAFHAPRKP